MRTSSRAAATIPSPTSNDNDASPTSTLITKLFPILQNMTNQGRAAILMSLAMSIHFFGYEFARSSNLAMFTSKGGDGNEGIGFSSPSAYPLAISCASPFSLLLLLGYGRELEKHGPKLALRHTTLFSSVALSLSGILISTLQKYTIEIARNGGSSSNNILFTILKLRIPKTEITPLKVIVWLSFVFQNSYAHLLYTQHWSFLGSILTPSQGATYFASVAGLNSITSTLAASSVGRVVEFIGGGVTGLSGLLVVASLSLVVSMLLSDWAYSIAEKHGFDPADEIKKKRAEKKEKKDKMNKRIEEKNMVKKAMDLFQRVPTLGALFFEVLSFQSLATMLNVCMVTKLKDAVTDDSMRAAWAGNLYAYVNGISGALQFIVLPLFLKRVEPKWIWRIMPVIPMCCSAYQCLQVDPALNILAFSFLAAKVMDYSLRNVVNEMVYVPLDFESRYVGKEIIGVFANRFGKSGMSLVLSGLTYVFGDFGIQQLSQLTTVMSFSWFACSVRLSNLIPKKEEAEAAVEKRKAAEKKQK